MDEEDIYDVKINDMQKYVFFLTNVVNSLKDRPNDKFKELYFAKMQVLLDLLTNRSKRVKLPILLKSEIALKSLYDKYRETFSETLAKANEKKQGEEQNNENGENSNQQTNLNQSESNKTDQEISENVIASNEEKSKGEGTNETPSLQLKTNTDPSAAQAEVNATDVGSNQKIANKEIGTSETNKAIGNQDGCPEGPTSAKPVSSEINKVKDAQTESSIQKTLSNELGCETNEETVSKGAIESSEHPQELTNAASQDSKETETTSKESHGHETSSKAIENPGYPQEHTNAIQVTTEINKVVETEETLSKPFHDRETDDRTSSKAIENTQHPQEPINAKQVTTEINKVVETEETPSKAFHDRDTIDETSSKATENTQEQINVKKVTTEINKEVETENQGKTDSENGVKQTATESISQAQESKNAHDVTSETYNKTKEESGSYASKITDTDCEMGKEGASLGAIERSPYRLEPTTVEPVTNLIDKVSELGTESSAQKTITNKLDSCETIEGQKRHVPIKSSPRPQVLANAETVPNEVNNETMSMNAVQNHSEVEIAEKAVDRLSPYKRNEMSVVETGSYLNPVIAEASCARAEDRRDNTIRATNEKDCLTIKKPEGSQITPYKNSVEQKLPGNRIPVIINIKNSSTTQQNSYCAKTVFGQPLINTRKRNVIAITSNFKLNYAAPKGALNKNLSSPTISTSETVEEEEVRTNSTSTRPNEQINRIAQIENNDPIETETTATAIDENSDDAAEERTEVIREVSNKNFNEFINNKKKELSANLKKTSGSRKDSTDERMNRAISILSDGSDVSKTHTLPSTDSENDCVEVVSDDFESRRKYISKPIQRGRMPSHSRTSPIRFPFSDSEKEDDVVLSLSDDDDGVAVVGVSKLPYAPSAPLVSDISDDDEIPGCGGKNTAIDLSDISDISDALSDREESLSRDSNCYRSPERSSRTRRTSVDRFSDTSRSFKSKEFESTDTCKKACDKIYAEFGNQLGYRNDKEKYNFDKELAELRKKRKLLEKKLASCRKKKSSKRKKKAKRRRDRTGEDSRSCDRFSLSGLENSHSKESSSKYRSRSRESSPVVRFCVTFDKAKRDERYKELEQKYNRFVRAKKDLGVGSDDEDDIDSLTSKSTSIFANEECNRSYTPPGLPPNYVRPKPPSSKESPSPTSSKQSFAPTSSKESPASTSSKESPPSTFSRNLPKPTSSKASPVVASDEKEISRKTVSPPTVDSTVTSTVDLRKPDERATTPNVQSDSSEEIVTSTQHSEKTPKSPAPAVEITDIDIDQICETLTLHGVQYHSPSPMEEPIEIADDDIVCEQETEKSTKDLQGDCINKDVSIETTSNSIPVSSDGPVSPCRSITNVATVEKHSNNNSELSEAPLFKRRVDISPDALSVEKNKDTATMSTKDKNLQKTPEKLFSRRPCRETSGEEILFSRRQKLTRSFDQTKDGNEENESSEDELYQYALEALSTNNDGSAKVSLGNVSTSRSPLQGPSMDKPIQKEQNISNNNAVDNLASNKLELNADILFEKYKKVCEILPSESEKQTSSDKTVIQLDDEQLPKSQPIEVANIKVTEQLADSETCVNTNSVTQQKLTEPSRDPRLPCPSTMTNDDEYYSPEDDEPSPRNDCLYEAEGDISVPKILIAYEEFLKQLSPKKINNDSNDRNEIPQELKESETIEIADSEANDSDSNSAKRAERSALQLITESYTEATEEKINSELNVNHPIEEASNNMESIPPKDSTDAVEIGVESQAQEASKSVSRSEETKTCLEDSEEIMIIDNPKPPLIEIDGADDDAESLIDISENDIDAICDIISDEDLLKNLELPEATDTTDLNNDPNAMEDEIIMAVDIYADLQETVVTTTTTNNEIPGESNTPRNPEGGQSSSVGLFDLLFEPTDIGRDTPANDGTKDADTLSETDNNAADNVTDNNEKTIEDVIGQSSATQEKNQDVNPLDIEDKAKELMKALGMEDEEEQNSKSVKNKTNPETEDESTVEFDMETYKQMSSKGRREQLETQVVKKVKTEELGKASGSEQKGQHSSGTIRVENEHAKESKVKSKLPHSKDTDKKAQGEKDAKVNSFEKALMSSPTYEKSAKVKSSKDDQHKHRKNDDKERKDKPSHDDYRSSKKDNDKIKSSKSDSRHNKKYDGRELSRHHSYEEKDRKDSKSSKKSSHKNDRSSDDKKRSSVSSKSYASHNKKDDNISRKSSPESTPKSSETKSKPAETKPSETVIRVTTDAPEKSEAKTINITIPTEASENILEKIVEKVLKNIMLEKERDKKNKTDSEKVDIGAKIEISNKGKLRPVDIAKLIPTESDSSGIKSNSNLKTKAGGKSEDTTPTEPKKMPTLTQTDSDTSSIKSNSNVKSKAIKTRRSSYYCRSQKDTDESKAQDLKPTEEKKVPMLIQTDADTSCNNSNSNVNAKAIKTHRSSYYCRSQKDTDASKAEDLKPTEAKKMPMLIQTDADTSSNNSNSNVNAKAIKTRRSSYYCRSQKDTDASKAEDLKPTEAKMVPMLIQTDADTSCNNSNSNVNAKGIKTRRASYYCRSQKDTDECKAEDVTSTEAKKMSVSTTTDTDSSSNKSNANVKAKLIKNRRSSSFNRNQKDNDDSIEEKPTPIEAQKMPVIRKQSLEQGSSKSPESEKDKKTKTSHKGGTMRELEKLNKDIADSFICKDILNLSSRRGCYVKSEMATTLQMKELNLKDSPKGKASTLTRSAIHTRSISAEPQASEQAAQILKQKYKCMPLSKKYGIKNLKVNIKRLSFDADGEYTLRKKLKLSSPVKKSSGKKQITPQKEQDVESEEDTLLKPLDKTPPSDGHVSPTERVIRNNNCDYHYHCDQNSLCLVCDLQLPDTAQLVNHYVNKHTRNEVLISRLPQEDIDFLVQNVPYTSPEGPRFRGECVFCKEIVVLHKSSWFEHILSHTGEYIYECGNCKNKAIRVRDIQHSPKCKVTNDVKQLMSFDANDHKIKLFACKKCNYVQHNVNNIGSHLSKTHHHARTSRAFEALTVVQFPNEKPMKKKVEKPVSICESEGEIIFQVETRPLELINSGYDSEVIIPDMQVDGHLIDSAQAKESLSEKDDSSLANKVKPLGIVAPTVTGLKVATDVGSRQTEPNEEPETILPDTDNTLPQVTSSPVDNVTKLSIASLLQTNMPSLIGAMKKVVNIGVLTVTNSHLYFYCLFSNCRFKMTNDLECLRKHVLTSHHDVVIKDACYTCKNPIQSSSGVVTMNDEIEHLKNYHLQINPNPAVPSTSSKRTLPESPQIPASKQIRLDTSQSVMVSQSATLGQSATVSQPAVSSDVKPTKSKIESVIVISDDEDENKDELHKMLFQQGQKLEKIEDTKPPNPVLDYLKIWLKETHSIKTEEICKSFLQHQHLRQLFKCMGNNCIFSADAPDSILEHFERHEKYTSTSNFKLEDNKSWLECPYCDRFCDNKNQFISHMAEKHNFSGYQCGKCFFRESGMDRIYEHVKTYHKMGSCPVMKVNVISFASSNYFVTEIDSDNMNQSNMSMGRDIFPCPFCEFAAVSLKETRAHVLEKHCIDIRPESER